MRKRHRKDLVGGGHIINLVWGEKPELSWCLGIGWLDRLYFWLTWAFTGIWKLLSSLSLLLTPSPPLSGSDSVLGLEGYFNSAEDSSICPKCFGISERRTHCAHKAHTKHNGRGNIWSRTWRKFVAHIKRKGHSRQHTQKMCTKTPKCESFVWWNHKYL